eukprot:511948-Rhodomonas_salina.2
MELTSAASVLASSRVAGFIFQFPAMKYLRSPPRRRIVEGAIMVLEAAMPATHMVVSTKRRENMLSRIRGRRGWGPGQRFLGRKGLDLRRGCVSSLLT